MTEVPVVRREVLVDLDPHEAFDLFTAGIGGWWPVEEHSVLGADSTVSFDRGEIIERLGDRQVTWGSVSEWRPGHLLSFSWHPGTDAQRSSRVTVDIRGPGTESHTGRPRTFGVGGL